MRNFTYVMLIELCECWTLKVSWPSDTGGQEDNMAMLLKIRGMGQVLYPIKMGTLIWCMLRCIMVILWIKDFRSQACWEKRVTLLIMFLEEIIPETASVTSLDGKGARPPEDSNGLDGKGAPSFAEFLDMYKKNPKTAKMRDAVKEASKHARNYTNSTFWLWHWLPSWTAESHGGWSVKAARGGMGSLLGNYKETV